jgi:hypothetical protein
LMRTSASVVICPTYAYPARRTLAQNLPSEATSKFCDNS